MLMVVQCINNRMTVETQMYENVNSSDNIIDTAYLQVYTPAGPICGQSWAPVRIIPLAVTNTLQTYLLYSVNNTLKLLYEDMTGFIVDAFVNTQPSLQLMLTQLSKQETYPNLTLWLGNPYYQLQFPITTFPAESGPSIIAKYIIYSTPVPTQASLCSPT
jgi:hypothetical protein